MPPPHPPPSGAHASVGSTASLRDRHRSATVELRPIRTLTILTLPHPRLLPCAWLTAPCLALFRSSFGQFLLPQKHQNTPWRRISSSFAWCHWLLLQTSSKKHGRDLCGCMRSWLSGEGAVRGLFLDMYAHFFAMTIQFGVLSLLVIGWVGLVTKKPRVFSCFWLGALFCQELVHPRYTELSYQYLSPILLLGPFLVHVHRI